MPISFPTRRSTRRPATLVPLLAAALLGVTGIGAAPAGRAAADDVAVGSGKGESLGRAAAAATTTAVSPTAVPPTAVSARAVSSQETGAAKDAPVRAKTAPSDNDDLLRFVPADVGLTVAAHDLHTGLAEFVAGPMFARWQKYPPLAKFYDEQQLQIDKLSRQLKRQLGVSWDDLRSRLFGRHWVLGVFPTAAGESAPDGFVLVRAADEQLLSQAAEKLFAAQKSEGTYLGSSEMRIADRRYVVHELKGDGKHPIYLTHDGDFGALAVRRETLERVLRLHAGVESTASGTESTAARSTSSAAGAKSSVAGSKSSVAGSKSSVAGSKSSIAGSLADAGEYRQAMGRLAPTATIRAFARPQAWVAAGHDAADAVSAADEQPRRPDDERLARETLAALTYAAAGIELGETPRLEIHIGWDPQRVPPIVRQVAAGLEGNEESARRIPADALVALAARVDAYKISTVVLAAVEEAAQKRSEDLPLEVLLAGRLLGSLGPGVIGYAVPPHPGDERRSQWLPCDWVVGVDTQRIGIGPTALVDTLDPLIRTLMSLTADVVNAKRLGKAKIETFDAGPLRVTGLTGLGPLRSGGVFVARQDGRLWSGSSPDALARGAQAPRGGSLATDPLFGRSRNPRLGEASHFLYVNFIGLRGLLDALLEKTPAWMPPLEGEKVETGLRETKRLLSLADAVLLEAAVADDGVSLSLAVTVDEQRALKHPGTR